MFSMAASTKKMNRVSPLHLEASKHAKEPKMEVEDTKPAQGQTNRKNGKLRENFPSDLEISLRISIVFICLSLSRF